MLKLSQKPMLKLMNKSMPARTFRDRFQEIQQKCSLIKNKKWAW